MKTKVKCSFVNKEAATPLLKEWLEGIGLYSICAAVPTLLAAAAIDARAEDVVLPKVNTSEHEAGRRLGRPAKLRFVQNTSYRRQPFRVGQSQAAQNGPYLTGSDGCPGTPIPAGSYTAASPYIDTGDTTGANNTVSHLYYYYYYYYDALGPDQIYSFVVTSVGPDAGITVTTTSPTYRPMIYVSEGCPSGENNTLYSWWALNDSRWGSGNTAGVDIGYLYPGRRYYVYVDSSVAADGGAYTLSLKGMQISSALPVRTNRPDFDGDKRADLSVFRPSESMWYIDRSSQGFSATPFGLSTDKIVPEDYDGDGKSDIAVFRNGDWWIMKSSDSTSISMPWGRAGDIPVPSDYSGDGKSEIGVFRDGQWWLYNIFTEQPSVFNFGQAGDKPVPGDYIFDGRSEIAVFRDGQWWIYNIANGQYYAFKFGEPGDMPVPASYSGNGWFDPAVYRDGTWRVFRYGQTYTYQWGLSTDVPAPADYNGDGYADIAVFRDGTWWIMQSGSGETVVRQFGQSNDLPAPAAYLP